jgi:hypothetical protein
MTAVLIDSVSIQPYIFSSNKLKKLSSIKVLTQKCKSYE